MLGLLDEELGAVLVGSGFVLSGILPRPVDFGGVLAAALFAGGFSLSRVIGALGTVLGLLLGAVLGAALLAGGFALSRVMGILGGGTLVTGGFALVRIAG